MRSCGSHDSWMIRILGSTTRASQHGMHSRTPLPLPHSSLPPTKQNVELMHTQHSPLCMDLRAYGSTRLYHYLSVHARWQLRLLVDYVLLATAHSRRPNSPFLGPLTMSSSNSTDSSITPVSTEMSIICCKDSRWCSCGNRGSAVCSMIS